MSDYMTAVAAPAQTHTAASTQKTVKASEGSAFDRLLKLAFGDGTTLAQTSVQPSGDGDSGDGLTTAGLPAMIDPSILLQLLFNYLPSSYGQTDASADSQNGNLSSLLAAYTGSDASQLSQISQLAVLTGTQQTSGQPLLNSLPLPLIEALGREGLLRQLVTTASTDGTITANTAAAAGMSSETVSLSASIAEIPQEGGNSSGISDTVANMLLGSKASVAAEDDATVEGTAEETAADEMMSLFRAQRNSLASSAIKVGESVNINSADFPEKIAEKITFSQNNSAQNVEIQLEPKELGKITINMLFQDGKALISIVCENHKAQALLNSHADAIRGIIQQTTGRDAVVETKQAEHENLWQGDRDGHNGRQWEQQDKRRRSEQETEMFIQRLRLGMAEV